MNPEDDGALKNASAIIERFGGIRPMAAKVGAPVTTVQGWKKRDVIPGTRREDVLRAANENSIDLSDVLKQAPGEITRALPPFNPMGGDDGADRPAEASGNDNNAEITVEPILRPQPKPMPASLTTRIDTTHEDLMSAIAAGQKRAVRASLWTTAAFAVLLAAAGAYALWPRAQEFKTHETRIATLEGKMGAIDQDVQAMNETAGSLKDLVPEEMQARMAALKEQADGIQESVGALATQAQGLSEGVLSTDAGSLSDRMSVLEAKLASMQGGQALADLTTRIKNLEVTIVGQQQLGASVTELTKIVDSLDGQVGALDQKLAAAQEQPQSPLGQTLEGVSDNDLKAAALLIAFSQLRDSLNRNIPFGDDVVLLQKLVGDDDPELQAALTRLAPQAEKGGVLTNEGLKEEFKGYAGDIVFSSLKGEDVSMGDKAKVRLTQMLNVKKNGELVGGTDTQKAVARAQTQLDQGDVQGAIATLRSLDGEAQSKAQPFIQQAEATLLADQIQNMLRQMIVANVGTDIQAASGAAMMNGGTTLKNVTDKIQQALPGQGVVKDEQSGFAILPAPKGFKGFSAGETQ